MALIDKASLLMVPSTYEAGKLYNVLPSGNRAPDNKGGAGYDQTRADFDFDRGSNAAATRINSSGLIEKYRENLLTFSNDFSNAAWVKGGASVTSGQSGYDGSLNASLLKGNTTNTQHRIYHQTSNTNINTLSVYVKASGHNYIQILSGNTVNQYANFDLSDGSIGNSGSDFTPKIESIGNDWYRISVFNNSSLVYSYIQLVSSKTAVWDESWAMPNATYGVLIQDAQVETGLVATDYLDSGATTAKAGVLVDMPRINYDANGENGALLLEPSRANLIPYSEYFGGSDWDKTSNGTASVPVLTYGVESPEGLNNAYEITFNTGAGTSTSDSSLLAESISGQSAGSYTLSFYAKVSSGTNKIIARGAGGSAYTTCNLTDQWQRFEITETLVSAGIIYIDIGVRRGLANEPLNSSVTCQIYGAQLEANATYATSYIPNHGTSGGVTRAADTCSVTGASDVIGQTEGTMYVDFDSSQFLSGSYIGISDGTTSNRQIFGFEAQSGNSGTLRLYGFWNGFAYSSFSKGQKIKVALAYKNNDFALYVNGTQAGTNTGATISGTMSQFAFNSGASVQSYQGNIYQATLFNERLTNAELATLTTL